MKERIPSTGAVDVYITKSYRALYAAEPARPFVAVMPVKDGWNDFGYRFSVQLIVKPKRGDDVKLWFRLMFKEISDTGQHLSSRFDDLGDVYSFDALELAHISLITDADNYGTFISALGFHDGVGTLRTLGDAVVARVEQDDDLLSLMDTEPFHLGILRSSNAYDALARGGRHLRPDTPPVIEDAAEDYIFEADLPSAENAYIVPFLFAPDGLFRDRFSVLVGRNGVGKSQMLNAIVHSLVDIEAADRPVADFDRPPTLSRVLVFSSVPSDPFPREIPAWRGIDYEYFSVNADGLSDRWEDTFMQALLTCKKSGKMLGSEENGRDRFDVLQEAFERIGIWENFYIPLRPGDQLPREIEIASEAFVPYASRFGEKNGLLMYARIDWSRSPIVLDQAGHPRGLSSGEYATMRFTAQLIAAIDQGSLLLLDEPETHLHPNFVSDIMEMLDVVLQATKSIAIIATHSAYVVRETPRSRVNVLRLHDREISVDEPRFQTFGANIDAISQFVFQDGDVDHAFERTLAEWAERVGAELGIDGVIQKYGDQLNPESLSFIARHLSRGRRKG